MRKRAPYSINGGLSLSVIQELEDLLALARRGELVALSYVAIDHAKHVYTGHAGLCYRDPRLAGGSLLQAAVRRVSDETWP